jgi:hypothetical protein
MGSYNASMCLLLGKGTDVHVQGRLGSFVNALQAASVGGRESLVRGFLGNALQACIVSNECDMM